MRLKTYVVSTGILFLLISIVHLARLIMAWPARIGTWDIPLGFSMFVLILAGYLFYEAFQLSCGLKNK